MNALMDMFSDEEFTEIIQSSYSYKECLEKLGYHSNSGDATNRLKKKIESLGLDTYHFKSNSPIKRTEENIFIEDSTASQKTLRLWYKKGQYTPYVCSICGQEPFWNGKELTLILDHINGRNHDNRLENLHWVCPNCNQQLDTTNGKNKTRLEKKVNLCQLCNKPISKDATFCIPCFNKQKTTTEVPGVPRELLKSLIRTTPFTQIGERFQVSDNTIRKWCDKYNLPRKATEIKQISDDDWGKNISSNLISNTKAGDASSNLAGTTTKPSR